MSEAEELAQTEILAVPARDVPEFYGYAQPHLERVLERFAGEVSEVELYRQLLDGRKQLWIAWDGEVSGAAVTEVVDYAEFSAVRIVALGGNHFAWQAQMDEQLDTFAAVHGCSRIEFTGRMGWVKKLPHYRLLRVTMARDVDGR